MLQRRPGLTAGKPESLGHANRVTLKLFVSVASVMSDRLSPGTPNVTIDSTGRKNKNHGWRFDGKLEDFAPICVDS